MLTDASINGLGAVLEQEQVDGKLHPIAYYSRSLSKAEKNYGITELEALGVVWGAKHFRAYLYGHKCVVFTDHSPLRLDHIRFRFNGKRTELEKAFRTYTHAQNGVADLQLKKRLWLNSGWSWRSSTEKG